MVFGKGFGEVLGVICPNAKPQQISRMSSSNKKRLIGNLRFCFVFTGNQLWFRITVWNYSSGAYFSGYVSRSGLPCVTATVKSRFAESSSANNSLLFIPKHSLRYFCATPCGGSTNCGLPRQRLSRIGKISHLHCVVILLHRIGKLFALSHQISRIC